MTVAVIIQDNQLHIVYVIAPGGGPEAYVKTLSPWLMEQRHQVSVIYTHTKPFQSQMPVGVRIYFTRIGNWHYYLGRLAGKHRLWAQRLRTVEVSREVERVLLQVHREKPVHVVELTEGVSCGGISRRFPVVIRAHGSAWAFRYFCQDDDCRWDHILVREQAGQFRHAHVVSPLSQQYAEYLSTACNVPRDVFQELPYPVDLDLFSPEGTCIPDAASLSLMSIGRLERRKGSDMAVQAMNILWEIFPNVHLYLLGNEAQFTHSYLHSLAQETHRPKIVFPGFVLHQQVPAFLRAMKVYLALTQYETFGYTLLEAMACGIPVVSCLVGAVPELVWDGVNGRLVPFGDARLATQAVLDLLGDDSLHRRMSRNGRETASAYSLQVIGPRHINMYIQTMDGFASR